MPLVDRFVAETTFHVRYAETDAMGVVHHASFIVYFEEGRSSYARLRGSDYANLEKSGYFLVVSEVSARYIQPARYGMLITICTWIEELKSRSVVFAYEILDTASRAVLVEGRSKHICVTKDGQVTKIPQEWRVWDVER